MIKSLLRFGVVLATVGLSIPNFAQDADPEPRKEPSAEEKKSPSPVAPGSESSSSGDDEDTAAVTLPAEYLENVLVVKTDVGAGTGFLCTYKGKLFVATNQHVIEGTKSLDIEGPTGEKFKPLNFIAARNVDIVLIGVAPGANPRRPLLFAENIEEVVTKGDEILVPGNSKGDGVITITPGKIIGVGPNKIEVDSPVYPGNSGGPIFHPKTKEVIGLLTEARTVSLDGAIDAASFKDGKSQIKSEVRIFGHRFDTAEKWYALNINEFRRNSSMIQKTRAELDALEAFFYPVPNINWKNFRELHDAVNKADQTLTSDKLSSADKAKAWTSLTGSLKSLAGRGVRDIDAKKRELTYTQLRDLEALGQRSQLVLQLCDILARDVEATAALLKRGGR
jgi:hypothetical protein